MQSAEGYLWRALFFDLVSRVCRREENHKDIASVLMLDELPDKLTDDIVHEAVQGILVLTDGPYQLPEGSHHLKPFGMGQDMPSQWASPTPVLSIRAVSRHAGVTEDAVRAAIRRNTLRHVSIDGSYFVRLSDAENYYGAWDADKSDRIRGEMFPHWRISIRNSIAYLLDPADD